MNREDRISVKIPMKGMTFLIKRSMDLMCTISGLILLIPFIVVLTVLIKLDSRGAVIYKQARVGRYGRPFHMYKFRSMVEEASSMKLDLQSRNEIDGKMFKIRDDPRMTRVGRWIRRYSIDELPQLLNVLKGDMSLVGPRPPLPAEEELYTDEERLRLTVLPGMTGLWQVSGRNNLSFEQMVHLDLVYIENWNLWLDIKLLFKTISVIIKGDGAY